MAEPQRLWVGWVRYTPKGLWQQKCKMLSRTETELWLAQYLGSQEGGSGQSYAEGGASGVALQEPERPVIAKVA